jgi:uncharacterized membrane protein
MVRILGMAIDAALILFVGVYAWMLPIVSRRAILFGVTVPVDARATPEGRAVVARYRLGTTAVTVLAAGALTGLAVFAPEEWWLYGTSAALPLVYMAALILPYLCAYRATRRLVAALGSSGDRGGAAPLDLEPAAALRPRRYGDYVPWAWEVLPLVIIGATVAYLAATYPAAPARIPTHFDLSGAPDTYSPKTVGSYFLLVWMQIGLEALLAGLAFLTAGSRALPGASEASVRRVLLRFVYAIKVGVLAVEGILAVGITAAAIAPHPHLAPGAALYLPLLLVVVILVGTFVMTVRIVRARASAPPLSATDRMNDRHWKLGIFYVHRQDPSLFVERRFGVGYTINLGNPLSWLVLLGILAVPMALVVVGVLATWAH